MAVQTVPYALQNASHSAALFRQSASAPFASAGILSSGELAVAQQSTPNMSIVLGPGRAKVAGTSVSPPSGFSWTTQAMYDVLNDASLTLTIAASNPTNPRIDAVYVQVQDSFYSGTNNQAIAGVVTGTPASSPAPPAVPTNAIVIAYVAVAANATTVVNANITQAQIIAKLSQNGVGLVPIIATSVVAASGAATVGPNGVVTVSGASTVSLNGIFTAQFDNYLIEYDLPTRSTAGSLLFRLRLAGVDDTGASNYIIQLTASAGASAVGSTSAASSGTWQSTTATQNSGTVTFFGPAIARATRWLNSDIAYTGTGNTFQLVNGGGQHVPSTAYDGLSIISGAGTVTGTIRVYGYNNN